MLPVGAAAPVLLLPPPAAPVLPLLLVPLPPPPEQPASPRPATAARAISLFERNIVVLSGVTPPLSWVAFGKTNSSTERLVDIEGLESLTFSTCRSDTTICNTRIGDTPD
jgi:hypothetical protein